MRRDVVLLMALLVCLPTLGEAGRTFNGSSQSGSMSPPVTAAPFTVCAWVRPGNTTALQVVVALWFDSDNYFHLRLRGDESDQVQFVVYKNPTAATVNTSTSYTSATWQHICAAEIATNSHAVWRNGAGKGTNSTSVTPTASSTLYLAHRGDSSWWYTGDIAALCVWNQALSDTEVLALAQGAACEDIRRLALVSCPRLQGVASPEPDHCAPRALTLQNTPPASATAPPVRPRLRP